MLVAGVLTVVGLVHRVVAGRRAGRWRPAPRRTPRRRPAGSAPAAAPRRGSGAAAGRCARTVVVTGGAPAGRRGRPGASPGSRRPGAAPAADIGDGGTESGGGGVRPGCGGRRRRPRWAPGPDAPAPPRCANAAPRRGRAGPLGHRALHQRADRLREPGRQRRRGVVDVRHRLRDRRSPAERPAPGERLVRDDAERVHVAGRRGRASEGLLRRQVLRRCPSPARWRSSGPGRRRGAMPKSVIFTWPAGVTSRLPGLTSRCTTPAACAARRPSAAWPSRSIVRSGGSAPSRSSWSDSGSPATSSITR